MTGDDHDDGLLRDPAGATAVLEADDRATDRRPRREARESTTRTRGTRSPAAQRAIERRRRRTVQRSTAELTGARDRSRGVWARLVGSPADALRRMPFAVLVVAILAVGLALTLWLSTTAAEDSYGLSDAREQNATLSAQRDALNKSYELANSAPELAKKAAQQGLIPSKDVARMVVGPDNRIRIVGDPAPASGAPAPALNEGTPRAVVPQPGSSTDGNTAAAPASGAVSGATDPAVAPAPNVLPGSGTATNTAPAASAATAPAPSAATAPAGTTPTTAGRQAQSGSTDSSVPR
ncbi:hypothetical protein [Williamsia serinedens]|uniref:Cell division protein FtsL n=1 Tax=Williamsia serinedens TaxID=391736 RepID=A0ABT1H5L6_9NOCA|nr:hypothetical protein [Williamsia serinedens]MCP2162531.1 hypothetical protein [Williamsia serinedens]